MLVLVDVVIGGCGRCGSSSDDVGVDEDVVGGDAGNAVAQLGIDTVAKNHKQISKPQDSKSANQRFLGDAAVPYPTRVRAS